MRKYIISSKVKEVSIHIEYKKMHIEQILSSYRSDNLQNNEHADDTGMFYGMKYYNDLLMEAGPTGNVQSEILLQKDKDTFTLKQGWAFPRKVYFNGDECMLPPPDTYPYLPNSAPRQEFVFPALITWAAVLLVFVW